MQVNENSPLTKTSRENSFCKRNQIMVRTYIIETVQDFFIKLSKINYCIVSFGLMASCQKWGIILVISIKKCALKLVFFNEKNSDRFGWFLRYKIENQILALFYSSPLIQNSKFNNFLWVCWFLGKNLSNFGSTIWKLHNPYCHSKYSGFNFSWDKVEIFLEQREVVEQR